MMKHVSQGYLSFLVQPLANGCDPVRDLNLLSPKGYTPTMHLLIHRDLAELRKGSHNCRADVVNLVHGFGEVVSYGLACSLERYFSLGDIDGDGYRVSFSAS